MNKPNFAKIYKDVQRTVVRHTPEILTGFGIAGMIGTTILAVSATPKAIKLIENEKKEKHKDKLTAVETVKTCWKCYVPAAVTGVMSASCIIGASTVNFKRNAALATAYKLSETALTEYREQVIETIGEKKEQVVREKIAENRLDKNPVNDNTIILTDKGSTLCMEPISGQYFRSDIDKIKRIINDMNERLLRDPFGYTSLNDLYSELGLETSTRGDDLGWNVSTGIIRVDFHAKVAKNNEPCIVLDYVNAPQYGYDSSFI